MKCLVLAGGFGNRLNLNNRAKALLEYKDKPLLTHIVEKVPEGIPILISINRRFESDFYQWQEKHRDRGIEILVESARSEEEKLGAVSALNFWIGQKGVIEDLMVIGGDNYFAFNLSEFITAYDGKNPLVAVHDIGEISRASQFGVVSLDGNRIVELQEKPITPKSGLVSTACYIFPLDVFSFLHSYCQQGIRDSLGGFIAYLVERTNVYAYIFEELWFDIGFASL